MRILLAVALAAISIVASGCQSSSTKTMMQPPIAAKVPKSLEKHGHVRVDDYFWLKERDDPAAIDYLTAEHAYTTAAMAHTESLQETLFEEIKGRIKQDDETVPHKKNDYFYYRRYEDGKAHPIHCRKKASLDASEEIMVDVNVLAEGHSYCSVGGLRVSSGQDILTYGVDTQGRRFYDTYFKNLSTGELLEDKITAVTSNKAWANDNKTLFYTKQDPQTLRSYRIYRHVLGTEVSQDELVYEETDDTFSCYVFKTKSRKYIMIASSQTLSSEYRFVDANNPTGEFTVFLPREKDHEYNIDHMDDKFYVRTNQGAENFRLMVTSIDKTARGSWTELIPHRDDVYLSGFSLLNAYLVLTARKHGLSHLRLMPWSGLGEHYLDFGEPAYRAYPRDNYDLRSKVLRFGYSSMATPNSVFDYDMTTRKKVLLKQDEVLGGFSSDNYETRRIYAKARDGAAVPISLVCRKGMKQDGQSPLLLYAYGSYGASMDAGFSAARISLLDRGFVYAIAHIRGGQEMGRAWYENGKLLKKKNTFTDYVDCAAYLVEQKYTNPDKLFAQGGSAGGLLMGAIINMRPDLFRGVVAGVPFVDVLTTMLDADIPLTTGEYDEWGDPNKKEYYDYMLSYSPYDNVEAKDYSNLLVTTGLHDSQVQYWEPAKWVAKLRAVKTDKNRLLLKTNMDAGHGGSAGRFKRYKKTAFEYAFMLDLAGIDS